jgi:hypothetical protein
LDDLVVPLGDPDLVAAANRSIVNSSTVPIADRQSSNRNIASRKSQIANRPAYRQRPIANRQIMKSSNRQIPIRHAILRRPFAAPVAACKRRNP